MTSFADHDEFEVPVPGGSLTVVRWAADEPGAPTILALHGITANALSWAGVVEALDGRAEVIAPDLRGRAGSRAITGPWGIGRDAADAVAVLDHLGLDRVTVAGHSMGGFVACVLARRFPDRVARVVAVDGGLGFPLPIEADPDRMLDAILGPAIARLSMTFDSAEAYLDYHRAYPAFAGAWTASMTAYIGRDVRELSDGRVVSSCVEEAIRADGRGLLIDDEARDSIRHLDCPVELLYAERGLLDEPQALYDDARLAAAALDPSRVTTTFVPGTNHYTIVGPGVGADAIAAALV